jgi:hypothetical protein
MSAIELIVDAYVRLGDHKSLEDLLAHRQRLAVNLKSLKGFNVRVPLGQIEKEIAEVLGGLNKLRSGGSEAGGASEIEPPG